MNHFKETRINAPIYEALKNYIGENPIPFHMPGHKMGKGIFPEYAAIISQLDVTEIPGTDNLHFPIGAIKESQELAAYAFGAVKTYFLVNGSSCGIHAAIMSVCRPGDKIIVSRDCHKSVIGGMMLAGANPVYVPVGLDDSFGIPLVVGTGELERTLEENPNAAAVLITRPNYYGVCSDIERIAQITHSYRKILIVDEAHGAHFNFHSSLPASALSAGADICIQSAHKTLPAFTQGAYLHLGSHLIDVDRLEFNLRLLQTTSPSYIIMTSLDIARSIMETHGGELLERLIDNIEWFIDASNLISGIKVLQEKDLISWDGMKIEKDITRVVINVRELGMTGYETAKTLREKFHIQVEMADLHNIVCIATVADGRKEIEALYLALKQIAHEKDNKVERSVGILLGTTTSATKNLPIPKQGMKLQDVSRSKGKYIALKNSMGEISRDFIVPYPPGIPVVCPGEIISGDIVEYIYGVIEAGGSVNGIDTNDEVDVVDIV
ncbi:MAG TPA: aminotransferase class I/II-fold pyridoxal phosphate-dependent enzyme [Clostridiales bacterium]|nr:aminotransferase class I/II-fold pyridoxal phosphate-dependent enzyme [Clostridiales bacterium]